MALLGGVRDVPTNQNNGEVESLARFAVDEHNKKENALLEFGRVVKAKEQVVAGTLHHLTLEIIEAGIKKLYEAKVWVKPWLNFKELQEFKPASDDDAPTITPSDLGCKKEMETKKTQAETPPKPAMTSCRKKTTTMVVQQDLSEWILMFEFLKISLLLISPRKKKL